MSTYSWRSMEYLLNPKTEDSDHACCAQICTNGSTRSHADSAWMTQPGLKPRRKNKRRIVKETDKQQ